MRVTEVRGKGTNGVPNVPVIKRSLSKKDQIRFFAKFRGRDTRGRERVREKQIGRANEMGKEWKKAKYVTITTTIDP